MIRPQLRDRPRGRAWSVIAACALVSVGHSAARAEQPAALDPAAYPELDAKQIGHLRHMLKLSRQLPGDWSEMGSNWWNTLERSLQYQLAFMCYAVGLAQYHYTPAYRELYREMLASFMDKMLLPDVWEDWSQTSRGSKLLNPALEKLGEGWIDPVKKDNIMYSAHVHQIAALYETLYREHKYDQPGAITFDHQSGSWGFGPEKFPYDLHSLTKLMYEQFRETGFAGIACEPNSVFPECNQHPILALMHYDHLYGTRHAKEVSEKFKEQWLARGYTHAETKSHMLMRAQAQDTIMYVTEAWADGWTGTFMHGWDKEFVESLYPTQRERHLQRLMYGTGERRKEGSASFEELMTQWEKRIGFGMFAILASEVGDVASRDAMLEYADAHFSPVWVQGRYYYPRNDSMERDERGIVRTVDTLTGNALLAFARLNVKDGIWKLYNQPWDDSHFREPYVAGVDLLAASVSQAVYDASGRALIVTLVPGPAPLERTAFQVRQLPAGSSYSVVLDGRPIGRFRQGDASADGTVRWDDTGALVLSIVPDRRHSFVITENPGAHEH